MINHETIKRRKELKAGLQFARMHSWAITSSYVNYVILSISATLRPIRAKCKPALKAYSDFIRVHLHNYFFPWTCAMVCYLTF